MSLSLKNSSVQRCYNKVLLKLEQDLHQRGVNQGYIFLPSESSSACYRNLAWFRQSSIVTQTHSDLQGLLLVLSKGAIAGCPKSSFEHNSLVCDTPTKVAKQSGTY